MTKMKPCDRKKQKKWGALYYRKLLVMCKTAVGLEDTSVFI